MCFHPPSKPHMYTVLYTMLLVNPHTISNIFFKRIFNFVSLNLPKAFKSLITCYQHSDIFSVGLQLLPLSKITIKSLFDLLSLIFGSSLSIFQFSFICLLSYASIFYFYMNCNSSFRPDLALSANY